MINFKIYNNVSKPSEEEKEVIVDFLYTHLEEFGDEKEAILKCLNFAINDSKIGLGGFILVLKDENEPLGITIVNKTGMEDYIPENILVYIAVHSKARGKGIGKKLNFIQIYGMRFWVEK